MEVVSASEFGFVLDGMLSTSNESEIRKTYGGHCAHHFCCHEVDLMPRV